jgi:hypothetical protein
MVEYSSLKCLGFIYSQMVVKFDIFLFFSENTMFKIGQITKNHSIKEPSLPILSRISKALAAYM